MSIFKGGTTMELDNKMVISDENGNEHLVEILFTYHNDERNKDYVFFYENGNEDEITVMIYNDKKELLPIEDDEEYEEAEEVLAAFDGNDEEEEGE